MTRRVDLLALDEVPEGTMKMAFVDGTDQVIVLGFLEPVVARVPLEAERERLRGLLEAKWDAGRDAAAAA